MEDSPHNEHREQVQESEGEVVFEMPIDQRDHGDEDAGPHENGGPAALKQAKNRQFLHPASIQIYVTGSVRAKPRPLCSFHCRGTHRPLAVRETQSLPVSLASSRRRLRKRGSVSGAVTTDAPAILIIRRRSGRMVNQDLTDCASDTRPKLQSGCNPAQVEFRWRT